MRELMLEDLTKEELIELIRTELLVCVSPRSIAWVRYQGMTKACMKESQEISEAMNRVLQLPVTADRAAQFQKLIDRDKRNDQKRKAADVFSRKYLSFLWGA